MNEKYEKRNEEANKKYPMTILRNHKNPIVRYQENNRVNKLLKLIGNCQNKRILDIGCGDGHLLKLIKEGDLYGIDLDKNMVKQARKNTEATIIQSDCTNIPLPSQAFDTIICSEVLEHVEQPEEAIGEMRRLIKTRGKIIINVPNERIVLAAKWALKKIKMPIKGIHPGMTPAHLRIYTTKTIKKQVEEWGLTITKTTYDYPFMTNIYIIAE